MTAYYTGRKTNYALRMAVQLALGRFAPTRLEEAAARIQASIQLQRHQQAVRRMKRMMSNVSFEVAKDPNPIRYFITGA